MESIEAIDRECAALGGLFQQVVNDMKLGVPHYEDFISKASKLHGHLKNTILALGSFLDTFQKIADAATNTKGATREIGACLTRIVIRHKAMESRMKTLSSALLDCLVLPLAEKMEEWRKVAATLDKEHSKEYKKMRGDLKKKTDNQNRLVKKQNKKTSKEQQFDPKVEQGLADVTKSIRSLHEVEKAAVRRVLIEERSRYCTFVACLKPVLGEEVSFVSELQQLEEVCQKLDKHTEDPFKLPESSEQVLADIKHGEGGVSVSVSYSPPSSPSSLGSRKSSMCSISSAGSSSGGSTNSPSHQAVQQHRHRLHQVSQGHPMTAPMRLSSISSQDSGFTSQDTLFLRPGEDRHKTDSDGDLTSGSGGSTPGAGGGWPGLVQGIPGPPMSDRPHTISSTYEKGHQRPSLQPYTFSPPDKTIPEEEEGETQYREMVRGGAPPVPQRVSTMERPVLPTQTQAALLAKQRIAAGGQITQTLQSVPTFNCSQPDMVVPQPVYMNMDDLAGLTARRHEETGMEEGLDMKTPTQEDQAGLASCSTSDGSSSGYGSQSTVRETGEQGSGQTDGPARQSSCPSSSSGRPTRPSLLRPNSYSGGVVSPSVSSPTHPQPISERQFSEALGQQLGVTTGRATILRRSSSQTSYKASPVPPVSRARPHTDTERKEEWGELACETSNSSTPRSSMEFLPPPPPHLLHSDEEEESVTTKLSVADSVRKLSLAQQQSQVSRGPPSPSSLRRVHSMSGPSSHQTQDRTLIMKRLDAALASPRVRGTSPSPHPHSGLVHQDQIYAPVAALQQKIQQQQQQQQSRLAQGQECGMGHPPGPRVQDLGPIYATSHIQLQQQHQQHQAGGHQTGHTPNVHGSPEGEQYGFGMQFQQRQQLQRPPFQQQQHSQQQIYQQQQQYQQQQHPHYQTQQHQYNDQLLAQVDPTLAHRPQPPQHNSPHPAWNNGEQEQVAAALRVRQWIETRTVSDVRKIRPILNQEIHKGFILRKNGSVNDRSVPRL